MQKRCSHQHRTLSRRFPLYIDLGFITDIHTHKQILQWNNAKMGKNETFHIHVKSEPGYSPKYPEHVFSVIGLSLCRQGFNHKLRQITKCDGSVAICDCRNLWRFKIQPIVCKWIYMSQGWYCQMKHKWHVYWIFVYIFVKLRNSYNI